jgi:hypothetical protein
MSKITGRKLQKVKKGRKILHKIWKIRGRFSSLIIKKVAKIPMGFSSINNVEKQNVENHKKLEKQLKHELFRYTERQEIC